MVKYTYRDNIIVERNKEIWKEIYITHFSYYSVNIGERFDDKSNKYFIIKNNKKGVAKIPKMYYTMYIQYYF